MARQPTVAVSRIASDAGVSRATFYRHFGSRSALLAELNLTPPSSATDRILEAAAQMLQRRPLADISTDELAARAGVGRATLYRLFPSKAALLGALIERYAPFEEVLALLERKRGAPPQELVPDLARTIMRSALPRQAVVRTVLMEATSGSPRNLPGIRPVLQRALGAVSEYLLDQMAAGRLRRMHPILALQVLLGPVAFHVITRPAAEQVIGMDVEPDAAADALAGAVLEGMLP